jgi:hypothetical protein
MQASCAGFVAGFCEYVPYARGGPPLLLSAQPPDMPLRDDHRAAAAALPHNPRRSLTTRSINRSTQLDVMTTRDELRVSPSSRIDRAAPNASLFIVSAPPRRRRAPIPPRPTQPIPSLNRQLIAAYADRNAVASAAEESASPSRAATAFVDRIVS